MPIPTLGRFIAVILAVTFANGCTDTSQSVSAPSEVPAAIAAAQQAGPMFSGGPSDKASYVARGTLLRRTQFDRDNEWTWTVVDPQRGGTLQISRAGVTVEFPAGAVAQPTLVWLVAVGGHHVIYGFGPHGTQFLKPVTIQQDLKHTVAGKIPDVASALGGGYIPAGLLDIAGDTARLSEVYATTVLVDGARVPRTARFSIQHFSGFVLASGLRLFREE